MNRVRRDAFEMATVPAIVRSLARDARLRESTLARDVPGRNVTVVGLSDT